MKLSSCFESLVALLCSAVLMGCQSAPSTTSAAGGSGFLVDYSRLAKAGSLRDRYLNYTDPAISTRKIRSVYLPAVTRHPANARFEGVDEAVVDELVAFANEQLRVQLSSKLKLTDAPDLADATVQVAMTYVGSQPAGKTILDVIPLRLVTNPIKDAVLGKSLDSATTMEVRVTPTNSSRPLRESLYQLAGTDIGRAGDAKTRIDAGSLKPAIERWARACAEHIVNPP